MSGKDPLPRELAYDGVRAVNPPDIISSVRNPNANDKNYPLGTMWMNTVTQVSFQLVAAPGVWAILGGAAGGDIQTLSGNTGGPLMPTLGNINIVGNGTQGINVTGAGSTLTVAGIDATTTQKGVVALATSAEAVTGSVNNKAIVPSTLTSRLAAPGSIGSVTPGQGNFTNVTASPSSNPAIVVTAAAATAGVTISADAGQDALKVLSGDIRVLTPGSAIIEGGIATGKDLVDGSGDIDVLNGDLTIESDGYGLRIKSAGSNSTLGTATLDGVGGTVTVLDANIGATDRIFLSRKTLGSAAGNLSYSITPATSFTITSDSPADDAQIDFLIIGQPA